MKKKHRKGLFFSFEGIDGSGKSVQAERLFRNLKELHYPVFLIREPGGTEISEKIREILLSRRHQGMTALTELFLYEAARAQLVQEIIIPELESNRIVLTDRFADSTIAYQAYGRQLPNDLVLETNQQACAGIFPDRTYVLDIPLQESKKRMSFSGKNDRMEKENDSFFERVRKGYLDIAQKEPNRILVLDGRKSMDVLEQEIITDVLKCIDTVHIQKKEQRP